MTGKWSQPNVPNTGWTCDDITDLGEPSAICEMCEIKEIRYVHHMNHPDYPVTLNCGCICAGKMEEDEAGAKLREKRLRNYASGRKRWLVRTWKISRGGNSYINYGGYNIVVYQITDEGWGICIRSRSNDRVVESHTKALATFDEARLHSYELVYWVRSKTEDVP